MKTQNANHMRIDAAKSAAESKPKVYAVEIYQKRTGEVVKRMDDGGKGMPLRIAERVLRGASINLNHRDYAVRIVEVVQP